MRTTAAALLLALACPVLVQAQNQNSDAAQPAPTFGQTSNNSRTTVIGLPANARQPGDAPGLTPIGLPQIPQGGTQAAASNYQRPTPQATERRTGAGQAQGGQKANGSAASASARSDGAAYRYRYGAAQRSTPTKSGGDGGAAAVTNAAVRRQK